MTIQWGYHFLTGIKTIDRQHEGLVALVNNLHKVAAGNPLPAEVDDAFHKLTDYATEHFALEEQLMAEAGIAEDDLTAHQRAHTSFVGELTDLWRTRDEDAKATTEHLLEFLTTWIYRHILITDHAMARDYYQKKGLTPPPSLLLSSGAVRLPGE
ncbi:MAG: hemerythrin family protein [Rhodocyclaceae bacterium]|nr:hemerythrin family protein [Rhodocyclaceae bacterium]